MGETQKRAFFTAYPGFFSLSSQLINFKKSFRLTLDTGSFVTNGQIWLIGNEATVGDIISGFESEDGITLHKLVMKGYNVSSLLITLYKPDDENFVWAVQQLAALRQR